MPTKMDLLWDRDAGDTLMEMANYGATKVSRKAWDADVIWTATSFGCRPFLISILELYRPNNPTAVLAIRPVHSGSWLVINPADIPSTTLDGSPLLAHIEEMCGPIEEEASEQVYEMKWAVPTELWLASLAHHEWDGW